MEMAEEARAGAHEGTLACDHQLHGRMVRRSPCGKARARLWARMAALGGYGRLLYAPRGIRRATAGPLGPWPAARNLADSTGF